jgi:uncharacterized Zn finger protein (UPF0148 family)
MKDNYDRSISLQCPTCGGTEFEQDEIGIVKCFRCERTLTQTDLRESNGRLIEAELEDLKTEILKDLKADIRKIFSKWK